jgi:hypothetical protein
VTAARKIARVLEKANNPKHTADHFGQYADEADEKFLSDFRTDKNNSEVIDGILEQAEKKAKNGWRSYTADFLLDHSYDGNKRREKYEDVFKSMGFSNVSIEYPSCISPDRYDNRHYIGTIKFEWR